MEVYGVGQELGIDTFQKARRANIPEVMVPGSFSAGGLSSGSRKVGIFRYTNVLNLVYR